MPTYPDGFPPEIISEFERRTGRRVLCNKPYSGTDVIRDYGREHVKTGALIVYTSADSVFQVAAHESVVPIEELYKDCEIAREILHGEHGVGRVIARPFEGEYPYKRTSNRHDFSLQPPRDTVVDKLLQAGLDTIGVGKIYDIFAGRASPGQAALSTMTTGWTKQSRMRAPISTGFALSTSLTLTWYMATATTSRAIRPRSTALTSVSAN